MRSTIWIAAVAVLAAGAMPAVAKTAPAKAAAFQLDSTSWTYSMKKDGKLKESIDADGNYITQTIGGKHIDHGTAVMKDGKACFTSKMNKDGEICWTVSPVKIGHSMVSTNNKGDKLKVTRVAYTPLSMPK